MGYLDQKKKQERIRTFLRFSVFLIALFTIVVLWAPQDNLLSHFVDWQFQYYVLFLLIVVYACFVGYFVHALVILMFLCVNYVSFSSHSNIFFNVSGMGKETLSVVYQSNVSAADDLIAASDKADADIIAVNPAAGLKNAVSDRYRLFHDETDLEKSFILTTLPVLRSGTARFASDQTTSYALVSKGNHEIMVINVDFSKINPTEEKDVFKNLGEFVREQNIPVIIVGDFGISSWKETFKHFLDESGMEVKNRFILGGGKSFFNPLSKPTINVLGYKALGVEDISRLEKNTGYPLLFKLSL